MTRLLRGGLIGLLIAGYPFIIYLLLTHNLPWLTVALVFGVTLWKIQHRDDWLWLTLGLLMLILAVSLASGPAAISKLSPLLIHMSLFTLFWVSLKERPLIEQFARLDFPELPPDVADYCRTLTKVWALFFAANIIGCLWLAFWGDDSLWVLYNGFIVYLLIGTLMLGEYIWRHIRFPRLEIPPLLQTVRNITRNGHKIWRQKSDERIE